MTTPTNQAAMTDEEAADLVRSFRNSPLLDHRSKWADAFAMAEAALRERGELEKAAKRYREWRRAFREGECGLYNALCEAQSDDEHDAAIDAALSPQPQGGEHGN